MPNITPKVTEENIGKEATILATRYPNHAEVIGNTGTITRASKKQNLYTIKFDQPVELNGVIVPIWLALPANITLS